MKISIFTVLYSLYLVISASFMRYVLNFIKSRVNFISLSLFIFILFLIVAIGLIIFLVIRKKFVNLFLVIFLIFIVILYTLSFNIIEERIHILQFGMLGFLVSLDNCKEKSNFFYSLIWIFIISAMDEIFQFYLPNRVGDGRDILFGIIGGLSGIVLYYIIFILGEKK